MKNIYTREELIALRKNLTNKQNAYNSRQRRRYKQLLSNAAKQQAAANKN